MRLNASDTAMKKKNRLNSATTPATTKKTLPCTPFLTSAVISVLASSTSARTRVETWVVTSLTSEPTEASPSWRTGSALRGIDGTTGGVDEPLVGCSGRVTGAPGGVGRSGVDRRAGAEGGHRATSSVVRRAARRVPRSIGVVLPPDRPRYSVRSPVRGRLVHSPTGR